MLPLQSDHLVLDHPEDLVEPAKSELDILASEMHAMLDRIESCWQSTPQIRGTISRLSGLTADFAASPHVIASANPLKSLLEKLRTDIGYVFATMPSR